MFELNQNHQENWPFCNGTAVCHYNDIIMRAMASKIASVLIDCSTVCSGADKKKSTLRVPGLCEVNSPPQRDSNAENASRLIRHQGIEKVCNKVNIRMMVFSSHLHHIYAGNPHTWKDGLCIETGPWCRDSSAILTDIACSTKHNSKRG